MKVLVVNGSPKGAGSNTMKLTEAVLTGIKETASDVETENLWIRDMDIKPCMGCMSCWGKTAGKCVIDDDMQDVYKSFVAADVIIYSFPLYFFGMPGPMKTFVDRLMPLMETYRGEVRDIGDSAFHEFRVDMSDKRFVIISTCGYGRTNEIYDSLIKEMNFIFGADRYDALLCPQGEMFAIPQLMNQINEYLKRYIEAGRCIGRGDSIPETLIEKTSEPIIPQRAFEMLVNRYWSAAPSEAKKVKTYYMFGDSIMRGVMPDESWNYHSSDAIGFDEMQKTYNINFVTYAMPTFTSDRVNMWMRQTLESQQLPDTAFLECGGNDCDYDWKSIREGKCDFEHRHRNSLSDFESNYESMIRFLQDKGVEVVCVITPPIPVDSYLRHLMDSGIDKTVMDKYVSSPEQMKAEFAEYAEAMIRLAHKYGCRILNLRERFLELDDLSPYYSMDGMHPNEFGYGLIRQDFEKFFSARV